MVRNKYFTENGENKNNTVAAALVFLAAFLFSAAIIIGIHVTYDILENGKLSGDLKPAYLVGEWLRITEEPIGNGWYEKDTSYYHIGLDSLPYIGNEYKDQPMTFYIQYEKGNKYGYLYDPEKSYDWEEEIFYLSFKLVWDLPEKITFNQATFMMSYPDSLTMVINSDTIGVCKNNIP
jgi:hypothetical protein